MMHTPGPWIVEPDARVGSITVTHTDGTNRSHVAVCPQMTLCEEHGSLLANARLIAASPDLLAALQDMRLYFGKPKRGEWLSDAAFGEALRADERARVAIEKATTP